MESSGLPGTARGSLIQSLPAAPAPSSGRAGSLWHLPEAPTDVLVVPQSCAAVWLLPEPFPARLHVWRANGLFSFQLKS